MSNELNPTIKPQNEDWQYRPGRISWSKVEIKLYWVFIRRLTWNCLPFIALYPYELGREHILFCGTVTLFFASENKPSFLFDDTQNNLWSYNLLLGSPEDICSEVNFRDGCLGYCYDVRGKVDKRHLEGIHDNVIIFYKWFLPQLLLCRNAVRCIHLSSTESIV